MVVTSPLAIFVVLTAPSASLLRLIASLAMSPDVTSDPPMSAVLTSPLMMSSELIVFAPPGWVAHATPPVRAKNSDTKASALSRR